MNQVAIAFRKDDQTVRPSCCHHRKPVEPIHLAGRTDVCQCTPLIAVPDVPPVLTPIVMADTEGAICEIAGDNLIGADPLSLAAAEFHPTPPIAGRATLIVLSRWLV